MTSNERIDELLDELHGYDVKGDTYHRQIARAVVESWLAAAPAEIPAPSSTLVSHLRDLSDRLRDSGRYSAGQSDLADASLVDEAIAALSADTGGDAARIDLLQWWFDAAARRFGWYSLIFNMKDGRTIRQQLDEYIKRTEGERSPEKTGDES